jgi:hypothetical protein
MAFHWYLSEAPHPSQRQSIPLQIRYKNGFSYIVLYINTLANYAKLKEGGAA